MNKDLFTPVSKMRRQFVVLFAAATLALSLSTLNSRAAAADEDTAYVQTANSRADKIVATLHIDDAAKAARVRDLISKQYQDLRHIHAPRDGAKAAVKQAALEKKEQAKAELAQVQAETDSRLSQLHAAYLKSLSSELTPEQVDQVKDGMTYGVLPLTYRVYQEMLPSLTEEQKTQILDWLKEAREHAMDAGSSDEKHAWFGKYKGRINNYLAKAGIDMKKAEKEMLGRKQK